MAGDPIVVVGAGPKAMALAAKCTVLEEVGFDVPELHIVERGLIGANWTGGGGYTNGRQPLGTSPEKDVGFPYNSTCWESKVCREIDRRMLRFSWQSFLVALGQYSDWIDRGRPAPEHQQWARYLQWVGAQVSSRVHLHRGEVTSIALRSGRWAVAFKHLGRSSEVFGEGLVLTGPGRVRLPSSVPEHQAIMTVETFWMRYEQLEGVERGRIAIVGAGETAAAVALALVQLGKPELEIDVVSPAGMAYSRGESFRENRVYSGADHANWAMLTREHRRDFIKRTDRGVFSQSASRLLDQADNIEILAGRMARLEIGSQGCPVLDLEYGEVRRALPCDYVVLATGADHLALFDSLIDDATRQEILRSTCLEELTQSAFDGAIEYDLAVRGLEPRLYLPMLAGLSQGPGFPNLSCLGRLADRILESLVGQAASPNAGD